MIFLANEHKLKMVPENCFKSAVGKDGRSSFNKSNKEYLLIFFVEEDFYRSHVL